MVEWELCMILLTLMILYMSATGVFFVYYLRNMYDKLKENLRKYKNLPLKCIKV